MGMKYNPSVCSSRRKKRNLVYSGKNSLRSALSRHLKDKYGVKNMTVKKGDEVRVMHGVFRGRQGRVIALDLRRQMVFIAHCTRENANGQTITIGLNSSNCEICTKAKSAVFD